MSDSSPPLITPGDLEGDRTPTSVHGVLLAAGTSSRYGESNKLLATLDGEPLVRHAARMLCGSAVDRVTVVVGYEADHVRDAVAELPLRIRENSDYEAGQSTSVRVGVEAAADAGADAVVIALGDMPHVSPATVDRLIDCYERGGGTALAAAYRGTRGNPVLFDGRFFDSLTDVSGDVGGRDILLSSEAAALVDVDDPGILRDVDTPADLAE